MIDDICKQINANFLIRVIQPDGKAYLRGAYSLVHELGENVVFPVYKRALNHPQGVYTKKLRNSVKIVFIQK